MSIAELIKKIRGLESRAQALIDEGKFDEAETLTKEIRANRNLLEEKQATEEAAAAAERRRADDEAAEARRKADNEAAEARRKADDEAAAARRKADDDAQEARRKADEEAAAEARRNTSLPTGGGGGAGGGAPGGVITVGGESIPSEADYEVRTDRSFHIRRFGTMGESVNQVIRELYPEFLGQTDSSDAQRDYFDLIAEKYSQFHTWIRFGDEAVKDADKRSFILSPVQIRFAIGGGFGVKEIRDQMISGDDGKGGFTVPEDWRMNIISRMPEVSFFRKYADVTPTTSDTIVNQVTAGGDHRFPSGVRAYHVPESGGPKRTALEWENIDVEIHLMMADARFTQTQLEDTALDVVGKLEKDIAAAMGILEQEKFLIGNGSKEALGIFKANGLDTDGRGKITGLSDDRMQEHRTGRSDGWAVAGKGYGIRNVPLAVDWQYVSPGGMNTFIVMNKNSLMDLNGMTGLNGSPIFANLMDPLREGVRAEVVGEPIELSEVMPDIAEGKFCGAFLDGMGYQIGDRVGMTIKRFADADHERENAVEFIARRRYGGAPIKPWCMAGVKGSTKGKDDETT